MKLQGVAKKQRPTKITDAVKNGGFVKYEREALPYRPAAERVKDWGEVLAHGNQDALLKTQSARCMDCGTPFCQQVQLDYKKALCFILQSICLFVISHKQ